MEAERDYSMPITYSPGGKEKPHVRVTVLCTTGGSVYLRSCNMNYVFFPNKSYTKISMYLFRCGFAGGSYSTKDNWSSYSRQRENCCTSPVLFRGYSNRCCLVVKMCILLSEHFTQDVLCFLKGQRGLSKMPVIFSLKALLIHTCECTLTTEGER